MKYVDCRYAGDAPVEFIKASEGLGRVYRECALCGSELKPGTWRKSITGKYKDEIGTRYYCATCCDRPSTGDPACLPNASNNRAGPGDQGKADQTIVAGSGASTCWADGVIEEGKP